MKASAGALGEEMLAIPEGLEDALGNVDLAGSGLVVLEGLRKDPPVLKDLIDARFVRLHEILRCCSTEGTPNQPISSAPIRPNPSFFRESGRKHRPLRYRQLEGPAAPRPSQLGPGQSWARYRAEDHPSCGFLEHRPYDFAWAQTGAFRRPASPPCC